MDDPLTPHLCCINSPACARASAHYSHHRTGSADHIWKHAVCRRQIQQKQPPPGSAAIRLVCAEHGTDHSAAEPAAGRAVRRRVGLRCCGGVLRRSVRQLPDAESHRSHDGERPGFIRQPQGHEQQRASQEPGTSPGQRPRSSLLLPPERTVLCDV